MPHYPKPRYRADRAAWVVDLPTGAGKASRRTLAKGPEAETREEAWRAYHRLMAERGLAPAAAPRPVLTVALACDLFLDAARPTVAPGTFEQYRIKLQSLADHVGSGLGLDALRPAHVAAWLAAHAWSDSTARGAIAAAKVMAAWSVREGYLAEDPLQGLKRPRMGRRTRTLAPGERVAIREACGPELADLLDALAWTGARPGEVMRLEAAHIDRARAHAELPGKTTAATGLKVGFPLVPPMLELCRRLAEVHPTGPLFRNSRGAPWTRNAVRCRLRRLRARLGLGGVTAYTYRHSFATDALERGIPIADVAALMNHRDIRTTMNYAHLDERREHLRRQAEKAVTPDEAGGDA